MLTVSSLVALNVSSCFTLCLVAIGATLGASVAIWDGLGALGMMLPMSFAVLALLKRHPEAEGLHDLVASTTGPGLGGVVVIGEWVAAVTQVVTQLEFCTVALAYPIDPSLGSNKIFLATSVAAACFFATGIMSAGVEGAVNMIAFMCIFGNGIPVMLLVLSAFLNAGDLHLEPGGVTPEVTGVLFGCAGLEISAFHLRELPVESRERQFRLALAVSILLLLALYTSSHLLVAGLTPGEVNLTLGMFQALERGLRHLPRPVMWLACWASAVGQFATTVPLMLGPLRGVAELLMHIPRTARWAPAREHGIACWFILLQTAALIAMGWVFLCTSAAGGFWLLTAVSSQATQFVYLIIYAAAWVALGGSRGMGYSVFLLIGVCTSFGALVYGFIPPKETSMALVVFMPLLAACDVVLLVTAYCVGRCADHQAPAYKDEVPEALAVQLQGPGAEDSKSVELRPQLVDPLAMRSLTSSCPGADHVGGLPRRGHGSSNSFADLPEIGASFAEMSS